MRDTRKSTICANAEADAVGSVLSFGHLYLFGGEVVNDPDDAVTTGALAHLRFAETAFNPAENGVITSTPLSPDMNTVGGDDARWFLTTTEFGDAVFTGTVGVSPNPGDADAERFNLEVTPSTFVQAGGEFHVGVVRYSVNRKVG